MSKPCERCRGEAPVPLVVAWCIFDFEYPQAGDHIARHYDVLRRVIVGVPRERRILPRKKIRVRLSIFGPVIRSYLVKRRDVAVVDFVEDGALVVIPTHQKLSILVAFPAFDRIEIMPSPEERLTIGLVFGVRGVSDSEIFYPARVAGIEKVFPARDASADFVTDNDRISTEEVRAVTVLEAFDVDRGVILLVGVIESAESGWSARIRQVK